MLLLQKQPVAALVSSGVGAAPPPRTVSVLQLEVLSEQAAQDEERHEQDEEQCDGRSRGRGPVAIVEEFRPHHAPDHQRVRAAEQIRYDELANCRNEDQHAACHDTRQG